MKNRENNEMSKKIIDALDNVKVICTDISQSLKKETKKMRDEQNE